MPRSVCAFLQLHQCLSLLNLWKLWNKSMDTEGPDRLVSSTVFAFLLLIFDQPPTPLRLFVEVLRPSQPNGVMSSAVSLPNHTFTGQA